MKVELIRAWSRRFESCVLELPAAVTIADALREAGWEAEDVAVFGLRADLRTRLQDGDRVEILRPLLADPKQARRRRAQAQRGE